MPGYCAEKKDMSQKIEKIEKQNNGNNNKED